jgi:hypothetical protein
VTTKRDRQLFFKRGYKYTTTRNFYIELEVTPYEAVDLPFVKMNKEGKTVVLFGYAWNGASGPTLDTLSSMIGSLVHDLGYQLIRLGLIAPEYKEYFDKLLVEICIEDGMWKLRATVWGKAVVCFGKSSCRPSAEPKEEVAP